MTQRHWIDGRGDERLRQQIDQRQPHAERRLEQLVRRGAYEQTELALDSQCFARVELEAPDATRARIQAADGVETELTTKLRRALCERQRRRRVVGDAVERTRDRCDDSFTQK